MSKPFYYTNLDKVLIHAILCIMCPLYPENIYKLIDFMDKPLKKVLKLKGQD